MYGDADLREVWKRLAQRWKEARGSDAGNVPRLDRSLLPFDRRIYGNHCRDASREI